MDSTQSFLAYSPFIGVPRFVVAMLTYRWILKQPAGNAKMTGIAGLIESGSMAFLKREYTILVGFLALITLLLAWKLNASTQLLVISLVL